MVVTRREQGARDHVAARRPRMQVSASEQQEVVDRFLAAIRDGHLQGLLGVLAPDVVVVADDGGLVAAAPRPIVGAERGLASTIRNLDKLARLDEIATLTRE